MDIKPPLRSEISGVAYSTLETQLNSVHIGHSIEMEAIEGDVVECGIAAGANFAYMMIGCMIANTNPNRTFWGYDSFEGIQLAGKKDKEQAGIGAITHDTNVPSDQLLISSGITAHSLPYVIHNLKRWGLWDTGKIKLIEGWVQKSMPNNYPEKIAILRLDMDVYDPTYFVLSLLYDKISEGGYIIIDDWALSGVRLAVEEFWAERGIKPEIFTIENSTPIYWRKE
jgi:O-methyltransferase